MDFYLLNHDIDGDIDSAAGTELIDRTASTNDQRMIPGQSNIILRIIKEAFYESF